MWPSGATTEDFYDGAGLISFSKKVHPDGTYTDTSYKNGIPTQSTSRNDKTSYYAVNIYNEEGRLASRTEQVGATLNTYTFYKNGQKATCKTNHPTGETTVEHYDEAGNLLKVDCYDTNGQFVKTKYPQ